MPDNLQSTINITVQSVEQAHEEIKKIITELSGYFKTLREGFAETGQEIENAKEKITGLINSLQGIRRTRKPIEEVTDSSNAFIVAQSRMSQAVLSLNYVIRDAPYLFKNFGLGVLAVGNNINPLIDALILAKKSAEEANISFGQLLLKSFSGPAGLIAISSLAVASFQAITFALEKNKQKVEEVDARYWGLRGSTLELAQAQDKLNKSVEGLKFSELETVASRLRGELYLLNQETAQSIDLIVTYGRIRVQRVASLTDTSKSIEASNRQTKIQERLNYIYEIATQATNKNAESLKQWNEEQGRGRKELEETKKALEEIRNSGKLTEEQWNANTKAIINIESALKLYNVEVKENKSIVEKIIERYDILKKQLAEINSALLKHRNDEAIFNLLLNERIKILKEIEKMATIEIEPFKEIPAELRKIEIEPIRKMLAQPYIMSEVKKVEYDETRLLEKFNDELRLQLRLWNQNYNAILDVINALGMLNAEGDRTVTVFLKVLETAIEIARVLSETQIPESEGGTSDVSAGFSIFASIIRLFSAFAGGFQSGGIVGDIHSNRPIPIIAHSGEMVLNKQQQRNLFAIISRGASTQPIQVIITGNLRMNRNDLVVELARTQRTLKNNILSL